MEKSMSKHVIRQRAKPMATFHPFSKLAPELRRKVWHFSLYTPQEIHLWHSHIIAEQNDDFHKIPIMHSESGAPGYSAPLLEVNRESRFEALKYYGGARIFGHVMYERHRGTKSRYLKRELVALGIMGEFTSFVHDYCLVGGTYCNLGVDYNSYR